jgi:hypothetical protein
VQVIYLPRWRIRFFLDDMGRNVIRLWLDEQEVQGPDRSALQSVIDICEYSGPHAVRCSILDHGEGFFSLLSSRKGGPELSPVFWIDPVVDTDITFLAGALLVGKQLKPKYAVGIAEENLETLRKYPGRWRRERIT